MKIRFKDNVSVTDSMIFESCYEDGLKMNFDEKSDIISRTNGFSIWMLVDDILVGECYGVRLSNMDEEIEDCDDLAANTIYCYSLTIMPAYQRCGLGRLLFAYWIGMCRNRTPLIVWHATSNPMRRLSDLFGAIHTGDKHEKWYKTDRTAGFYRYEF